MTNPISQIRSITNTNGVVYDSLVFWCPGCEFVGEDGQKQGGAHMLPISDPGDGRPQWTFSGIPDSPTLSPSILSRVKFRRVNGEVKPLVCHSFMQDGELQYLSDCTHEYANQTIPLPPLPDWLYKEKMLLFIRMAKRSNKYAVSDKPTYGTFNMESEDSGFWFCYYSDYTGMKAFRFDQELEARRYSGGNSMSIAFIKWGDDIR